MDIAQARCAGCSEALTITQLECTTCGVALRGEFEVGPLARLAPEDQVFVHAFVRHHGSIKKMENLFGISYPTVKNRLNAIAEHLEGREEGPSGNAAVLEELARGAITVAQALERLS